MRGGPLYRVQFALEVLGCKAAISLEDQEGHMSCNQEVGDVCRQLSAQSRGAVKPADRRRIVSESQDAVLGRGSEALEPNIDGHCDELEQVVDHGAAM